jgi:hypothetical protein
MTETTTIRIFVNAVPIDVPAGTDVRGAVQAADADLGARVTAGTASVVDARGIALAPNAHLVAGSILRVVVSARRRMDEGDEAAE